MRRLSPGLFATLGLGLAAPAFGEPVTYRFTAELSRAGVQGTPPAGSLTAQAADLPRLTGLFSYEPRAPQIAQAEHPGRVAFADYATGHLTLEGLDTGQIRGEMRLTVTDGIALPDTPHLSIADEISLGWAAVSTATPIDAVSLTLRYDGPMRLTGTAIPEHLTLNALDGPKLVFSTRVDQLSNRAGDQSATGQVLGMVVFAISGIERVD